MLTIGRRRYVDMGMDRHHLQLHQQEYLQVTRQCTACQYTRADTIQYSQDMLTQYSQQLVSWAGRYPKTVVQIYKLQLGQDPIYLTNYHTTLTTQQIMWTLIGKLNHQQLEYSHTWQDFSSLFYLTKERLDFFRRRF